MKGEVYGKRDLSPLVGMDKKQSKSAGSQKPAGAGKPRKRK
jgi:small subunit ribosomal protein S3